MTDDDAPPPKRRRKPPKGLGDDFDTGLPPEPDPVEEKPSSGVPRKALWRESSQHPTMSGEIDSGQYPALDDRSTEASAPVVDASLSASASSPPDSSPTRAPDAAAPSARTTDAASSRSTRTPDAAASSRSTRTPDIASPDAAIPEVVTSPIATANILSSSSAPIPSSPIPSPSGAASLAYPAYVPPSGDEPLPSPSRDLRDAVGAKPKKKRKPKEPDSFDDDIDKPRSRKLVVVAILSLVLGLGITALVFLGRANSSWLYISCDADKIVVERGRSFPPWGETRLEGKQWAPIKIPPEAECIALETEDEGELATRFREMLVKRASVLLTAKEVTKTDEANALLEQALLHTRSTTDAARNARVEIQRLLGDVVYWRASLKMRDASKALLEAAKQFDAAAQQRPRHVTDAATWAEYVRKIVGELEAGPSGISQATFPPTPPTEPKQPAPPGVALPVEPDKGSAAEPPPPPADAGLPTGGVLL